MRKNELLSTLLAEKTQAADLVDEKIIEAMDQLRQNCGVPHTRSLLLAMMLKFSSDSTNAIEDQEHLQMLHIFEIFNVA